MSQIAIASPVDVSKPIPLRRYTSSTPFTVFNALSKEQVTLALSDLDARHVKTTANLDRVVSSQHEFSRQIAKVDLSRARLTKLSHSARSLSQGNLASAAQTASRISAAVERLDLEQSRVKATLAVVEQVAELKSCVLGVTGSMGAPQDWETAAEYLSRASKIPQDVVNSGFAEQVVPTAEVPDPPATTLHKAAESLCQLFVREFEKAVQDNDGARVTRFFKMFPLIGRSEQGLAAYARYVCTGVSSRARLNMNGAKRGPDFISALTKLFEHIAQVIDSHSGLVERHYGQGTMVRVVERLHSEADVQGGIILDSWSEERVVDRKLTDVKSYAFQFLVQSFLSTKSSTPRSASPAPGHKVQEQDEGVDMKEVDSLLNDIAAMLSHWSLYQRFVSSRAVAEADKEPLQMPLFLAESNLPKKVTKHLIEPFNIFATFFLRRSVEKAFQLDESPTGLSLQTKPKANPPFITSAVDDVMYMVNQIIQRTLATSQGRLMTSIVATVGRVLGSEFIRMIHRKMLDESYPRPAISGAVPPEHKIVEFLVLINNLDIANNYLERIVQSALSGSSGDLNELFPMANDASSVRISLNNLEASFSSKATELINDGLTVAFTQVIKPRLWALLNDLFKTVDYTTGDEIIDDEEETQSETFKARFEAGWSTFVKPVKLLLTEANGEKLVATIIAWLSGQLEKRIWSYSGRVAEAGTLKLERNVSDIANCALRGEHFRQREAFARCFEIVTLMTMEDDEWEEVRDQDGHPWVLDDQERLAARSMLA